MAPKSMMRKPSAREVSSPINFVHTSAGQHSNSPTMQYSPMMPAPATFGSPPAQASRPTTKFFSFKSWGKNSKAARQAAAYVPSQELPNSASTSSNQTLTSAFDWDSSSNTSFSSPDTSPEARRRSPVRKTLQSNLGNRADTHPPAIALPDPKRATQSPPFDPSFERAAAASLIESRSSSNNSLSSNARLQPLTLGMPSPLTNTRIPSMRFDDLSMFFRDLEEKLAFKAGEVVAMDPQALLPAVPAIPEILPKRSRSHRKVAPSVEEESLAKLVQPAPVHDRNASISSLPYARTQYDIPSLVITPEAGPSSPKKPVRPLPSPIAIPEELSIPAKPIITNSPSPQADFAVFSPRLSDQSFSLGEPFSSPPELHVQPPTPVLSAEGVFPIPPPRRPVRPKAQSAIPPRRSSRSAPVLSDCFYEPTSPTVITPPLSPSSSTSDTSSVSLDSPTMPKSESSISIACDSSEIRLSTLISSLQEPISSRPVSKDMEMTSENLAKHQSALSSLVDQAMSISTSSKQVGYVEEDEDEEEERLDQFSEYDEENEGDDFGTEFDDAPSLRSSPSSSRGILVDVSGGDLANGFLSSSSLATTVSCGESIFSERKVSLVRRKTRHAVKDSLGDVDEAVVVMCDRIEVGMAL